jgi:hypothetical protein
MVRGTIHLQASEEVPDRGQRISTATSLRSDDLDMRCEMGRDAMRDRPRQMMNAKRIVPTHI